MLRDHNQFEETENRLNKGALWAIVYGDFMSYMMIFFLLMFTFSLHAKSTQNFKMKMEESLDSIQKSFGGRVDQDRLDRLMSTKREEDAAKLLQAAIDKERLQGLVDVDVSEQKVRVTMKEPVLFLSGQANLRVEAKQILWNVAQVLKPLNNQILVEGHTDDMPIRTREFPSNWQLSQARALSVVEFLMQEGIAGGRLATVGYGQFHPAVPNVSSVNRAKNRRIEISIMRAGTGA